MNQIDEIRQMVARQQPNNGDGEEEPPELLEDVFCLLDEVERLRAVLERLTKPLWMCRSCGVSLTSSGTWCDLGCGSDYNVMKAVRGLPEIARAALEGEG